MNTPINNGDKLYTVTRKDISPGYQAVQSSHAYVRFCMEHPEIAREWYENSETMCSLSVADEKELQELLDEASRLGITVSAFFEPDIDFQLTAITLAPGCATKELCANLKLALREYS